MNTTTALKAPASTGTGITVRCDPVMWIDAVPDVAGKVAVIASQLAGMIDGGELDSLTLAITIRLRQIPLGLLRLVDAIQETGFPAGDQITTLATQAHAIISDEAMAVLTPSTRQVLAQLPQILLEIADLAFHVEAAHGR